MPVELVFPRGDEHSYILQSKLACGSRPDYHPKAEAKAKKVRRKTEITSLTGINCYGGTEGRSISVSSLTAWIDCHVLSP